MLPPEVDNDGNADPQMVRSPADDSADGLEVGPQRLFSASLVPAVPRPPNAYALSTEAGLDLPASPRRSEAWKLQNVGENSSNKRSREFSWMRRRRRTYGAHGGPRLRLLPLFGVGQ